MKGRQGQELDSGVVDCFIVKGRGEMRPTRPFQLKCAEFEEEPSTGHGLLARQKQCRQQDSLETC